MQGRSTTTTMDPAISSWLSLYAGAEVPARTDSGRKMARRKRQREGKGSSESMCCPFIRVFTHPQSVFVYVQFMPYMLPT